MHHPWILISGGYKPYFHLTALRNEVQSTCLSKRIYQAVGEAYGCKASFTILLVDTSESNSIQKDAVQKAQTTFE